MSTTKNPSQTLRKARRVIHAILENNSILADTEEIASFEYSLELCRMWLGKLLGYLGDHNPYAEKDGERKTVEDIEPVADAGKQVDLPICMLLSSKLEYVEIVDKLRIECNRIEKAITETEFPGTILTNPYFHTAVQNCWSCVVEAGMWLGSELGRIRDQKQEV